MKLVLNIKSKSIFLTCLICILYVPLFAQYDFVSRVKFAEAAFRDKNYKPALIEYKALFKEYSSQEFKRKIAGVFFLLHEFDSAAKWAEKDTAFSSRQIRNYINIFKNRAIDTFYNNGFQSEFVQFMCAGKLFYESKIINIEFADTFLASNYYRMLNSHSAHKYIKKRTPFLAGFFSAVVPGSGKIYAGRPLEAVSPFLKVLTCGLIAYEGYYRNGFNSPQLYLACGVGAYFYFSGIVGSVKTARQQNFKHEKEYKNSILKSLFAGVEYLLHKQ